MIELMDIVGGPASQDVTPHHELVGPSVNIGRDCGGAGMHGLS